MALIGEMRRGRRRGTKAGGAETYSGGRYRESQVGEDDARASGSRVVTGLNAEHRARKAGGADTGDVIGVTLKFDPN